jgi:peptidoglycan hydrolase-like protein with peptidoglycan-binding domain
LSGDRRESMTHSTIQRGSKGPDVALAQKRLNERGYGPLKEDGIFGPLTEKAVRAYQTDRTAGPPPGPYALSWPLVVDGIVGPETWGRLDPPLIKEGSPDHRHVYLLQNLLIKSGVVGANPGPVDGDFGKNTKKAVMAFQKWAGIPEDGEVGPVTWGKLHS